LPILANILLTTDGDRLRLSATNLEIGINCWIDAEIQDEGSTTMPAKTFTELVNSLAQGDVSLTLDSEKRTMNIKTARSNANVKGMDPSEYPLIPSVEGSELPITFDAGQLKTIISQVVIAAATDDSRPIFTGVMVEVAGEQVTFASADSFRLAVLTAPCQYPDADPILIPAKTLAELARILPSEGEVQMIVTPNRSQVLFHTEQVDLVSRLIEGTFPNIRAAIPKQHTTRALIETKEFASAVKMIAPFARDSSNIARVRLGNGTLTLEANAEDVGDNAVTISAAIDGPDQQIIFNSRYLAEVLGVLDVPEVALHLVSAASPGVLRPVGGGDFTYVIMPMSTNR
jgi:DNA polymerase-3 subunit beta